MASTLSAPPAVTVDYPSSDGKPMAESDSQRKPLTYAVDRLELYFSNDPDVYVSGNILLYYEEDEERSAVAPDVLVAFGVPHRERSSYFLWEERKAPDFVLEITSRSTWREDQNRKRELYRRLGVREYWQYDPTRDYLEPPLQGLELVGGAYRRLPDRELADGTMALWSAVLGLELRLQLAERRLRFHDPTTGKDLPDFKETDNQRQEAEDGREQEAAARQAAEARAQQEAAARRQAETRVREEAAARQAAEVRVREKEAARQAAEARISELEALLRRRPDTRNSQR